MPDLSTAPEIERMTMGLGAREMSPPGFIQAKRAKRAAPIPTASPASPLWRAAALECVVAEELADPDPDPAGLVLVEVAGLVAAGVVVGVTGVVLAVVVPPTVVVPVPVPVPVEVPEAVRQAVLVLDWTVNGADWARAPVLSRRLRPREVPAVTLTIHVSEVPVWVPKSRIAAAVG